MNVIRRLLRRVMPASRRGAQGEPGLYRRVRNLELALNAILDGLDYRPDETKGFNGQAGRKRIFDDLLTHCGFKAFRAEAAERIFSHSEIDGWGFDIEVLALARALHYKIGIIPAHWINDDRSNMRLRSYMRALMDIVRLRAHLRRFPAG